MTDTNRPSPPAAPDDVAELVAFIRAGGVWGLAPAWVPRDGYVHRDEANLRAIEAGLKKMIA